MPVAKAGKQNAASGLTFITFSHPDQVLERGTQSIIRSKALSSVSRAKKKKLPRPVVLDLEMLQNQPATSGTDLTGSVYELEVVHLCRALELQVIPPALPHLGIFAVEPDYRARELLFFSTYQSGVVLGESDMLKRSQQCPTKQSTFTDHSERSGSTWLSYLRHPTTSVLPTQLFS